MNKHKNTKVCMLSKTYPPDVYCGAGVHVTQLSQSLAELISVDVRCFGAQNTNQGRLSAQGFSKIIPDSIVSDPKHLRVVDGLVRSAVIAGNMTNASIIHAHDWYTFIGGAWMKMLWGVPLIVTVHSLEPMRPWKTTQIGKGGYKVSSWMEKQGLDIADKIITVSNASKSDIVKYFPEYEEKIHVINNAIDPEVFHPTEDISSLVKYGVDLSKKTILFVGRITKQKGIGILLEAITKLPQDYQIILCMGHADDSNDHKKYTKIAKQLRSLGRLVIWIEGLSGQQLVPLYSFADIVCTPSYYETFAIVNLEAMACGTPVVASNCKANKEQIIDGKTGFLFNLTGDQENEIEYLKINASTLAERITQAISNDESLSNIANNAKKYVANNHTWTQVAQKTMSLYSSVINKNII